MILGEINAWAPYKHIETGRIVETTDTNLLVKADDTFNENIRWRQHVAYRLVDDTSQTFAAPIDVFRRKFKRIES